MSGEALHNKSDGEVKKISLNLKFVILLVLGNLSLVVSYALRGNPFGFDKNQMWQQFLTAYNLNFGFIRKYHSVFK